MLHVDTTCVWISLDFDRLVIGKSCARGIGAVGIIRDQHQVAMALAIAFMVGFDQHQAGQLTMRACGGL